MVDVDESAVWRCAVKEYVDNKNGRDLVTRPGYSKVKQVIILSVLRTLMPPTGFMLIFGLEIYRGSSNV